MECERMTDQQFKYLKRLEALLGEMLEAITDLSEEEGKAFKKKYKDIVKTTLED